MSEARNTLISKMKRPKLTRLLLLTAATLSIFATQQAISTSDHNNSINKNNSQQVPLPSLKSVPISESQVAASTRRPNQSEGYQGEQSAVIARPVRARHSSTGNRTRRPSTTTTTTTTNAPPLTSSNDQMVANGQLASTPLDPQELLADEVRRMLEYKNTPPLFVTQTRDFFVDVARCSLGSRLATIQAIDEDGDRIEFSLKPANSRDASPYFSVNATSGELKLANRCIVWPSVDQVTGGFYATADSHHKADETNNNKDVEDDDEDDDHDSSHREPPKTVGRPLSGALERPDELYYLNVVAFDGKYSTILELQIHVFNSSSFGTKSAVQLTSEGSRRGAERLESLMRAKQDEFFNILYKTSIMPPASPPVVGSHQGSIDNQRSAGRLAAGGNYSTLVYPNFVNPSLVRPQQPVTTDDEPLQAEIIDQPSGIASSSLSSPSAVKEHASSGQLNKWPSPAAGFPPSTTSPTLAPSGAKETAEWIQSDTQQVDSLVVGQRQPVIMSIVIIVCASLIVALVLLAFVVPLSVKRLRKRLKNVERQHEQLSQKASTGGSTINCSSSTAGDSMTATSGRLPSLSQFTLSSSDRSQCTLTHPSHNHHHHLQVCRKLSLDSMTSNLGGSGHQSGSHVHDIGHSQRHPISGNSNHLFAPTKVSTDQHQANTCLGQQQLQLVNRVQHGSIANPLYLQQHHNQLPPREAAALANYQSQCLQHQSQAYDGFMRTQVEPVGPGQSDHISSGNHLADDLYYPLDDEFYSTINTESTIIDSQATAQHHQQQQRQLQCLQPEGPLTMSGLTCQLGAFPGAQCAQPLESRRPVDGAESPSLSRASSRSSTRFLARFLSLPARRQERSSSEERGDARVAQTQRSYVEELDYHLNGSPLKVSQTQPQEDSQQNHFSFVKTIARTIQIQREQQSRAMKNKSNESAQPTPPLNNARVWELERHKLRFVDILDEGQFGQVWRTKLRLDSGNELTVAVKTLKKSAAKGEREREELTAEIEIMKLVCQHPNVVKLLHCCTDGGIGSSGSSSLLKPILLVMEYVELGKLQSFLENSRRSQGASSCGSGRGGGGGGGDGMNSPSALHMYDRNRERDNNQIYHQPPLTSRDLIKFIYHVAKGMEYISSKCIVHRDLASRNILVSAERVCKIGDFGMARHTQSQGDFYERHSRNTKIPVRWMAPEVLLNNRFTTKSDVFSFGILMWEIVTLGSTPYTHLKTEQVVAAVAQMGERPSRPDYCHAQLYQIMATCWHHEPDERPTFKQLVGQLDELLLSANDYIKLDQYPDHNYYNIDKTTAPYELL